MPADGVPPGENCLHAETSSRRAGMRALVLDRAEDTDECAMTSHTASCEVTSVETQSQVEHTRAATAEQELENALTQTLVTTLKKESVETSADLTALEKKGLDRKTNHQGLMKAETQPRPAKPLPWRRCDRGRKFVVACILVLGARG